ncbi:MAG: AI-2E family transporter [Lachnospiraceae bacterium]|nr:AI-2E family transporter [Lachnospiraceae bacterium]
MKKILEKLDQRYMKVCIYASVTVLITIGVAALLLSTGPFWSKLWGIFTAVLKPIVVGGIISYLFLPIVNKFEEIINRNKVHKWARPASVILVFGLVIAVILIILVIIAVTVYENVETLNVDSIKGVLVSIQNDYKEVWQFVDEKLKESNVSPDNVSGIIASATNSVKSFFSGLLFGVIFSIYFMLDGKNISKYWSRAFVLIFGKKSEDKLFAFMRDADKAFSGYIRGQFLDALIIGVMSMVALSLAGVPNGVIVGLFVGIGNMIPYVGPVVGYCTLVIVCLPQAAIDKLIIGIIILSVAMFIDGNVINPKLLSNTVNVHPLLVVAALIGGGTIGGIAGMLVAVPTAALIKLQFDRYLEKKEKMKTEQLN